MSSMKILQQIPVMPEADIRLIEAALRVRRVEAARRKGAEGGIRPGFEEIVEKVFSTHGELLYKLSQ